MKKFSILFILSFWILTNCSTPHFPEDLLLLDMVVRNPGEPPFETSFNDPEKLKSYNYNGQVFNNFLHFTLKFEAFDSTLYPTETKETLWMDSISAVCQKQITQSKAAGLKTFAFIDLVAVPRKLLERHKNSICDPSGRISLDLPKTKELISVMVDEIFKKYSELDGLVIRTGEIYLFDTPFHVGNNPIHKGEEDHIRLIQLLKKKVCEKRKKTLVYRTWSMDKFNNNVDYYLKVTDKIKPDSNLYFSIKHTSGDFLLPLGTNKTIGEGNHQQLVEVQCQREFEGKGAYPNYIGEYLINGSGNRTSKVASNNNSFSSLTSHEKVSGILTWSRGGGWKGPYISNELWADLNSYVITNWIHHKGKLSEEEIFNNYAKKIGVIEEDIDDFRELCLLSVQGILKGQYSKILAVELMWTRDEFIAGEEELKSTIEEAYEEDRIEKLLNEKEEAIEAWERINELAQTIQVKDKKIESYIRTSALYGLLRYKIIYNGWIILFKGFEGRKNGNFDTGLLKQAFINYDDSWRKFEELKKTNPDCPSLYQPYSFHVFSSGGNNKGMKPSVDKYRFLVNKSNASK